MRNRTSGWCGRICNRCWIRRVFPCQSLSLEKAGLVGRLEFLLPAPTPMWLILTSGWFPSLGNLLTSSPLIPCLQSHKVPLPPKTSLIPSEQNRIALVTCTIPILQFSFLENDNEYSFTFILSLPVLDMEGVVSICHLFWLLNPLPMFGEFSTSFMSIPSHWKSELPASLAVVTAVSLPGYSHWVKQWCFPLSSLCGFCPFSQPSSQLHFSKLYFSWTSQSLFLLLAIM